MDKNPAKKGWRKKNLKSFKNKTTFIGNVVFCHIYLVSVSFFVKNKYIL